MKGLFDALNVIYGEKEKQSFIWLAIMSLSFTVAAIVFLILTVVLVAVVPLIAELPRTGERNAMAVQACEVAVPPPGDRRRARNDLSLSPKPGRAEMAVDHLGQWLCGCCLDCAVPVVLLVCCQFC